MTTALPLSCAACQLTVMARVVEGLGTAAPVAVGAGIVIGFPNGIAVTPALHGPGPSSFFASTRKVYVVPLVSPVNVVDVVVPPRFCTAGPLAGAGLISAT